MDPRTAAVLLMILADVCLTVNITTSTMSNNMNSTVNSSTFCTCPCSAASTSAPLTTNSIQVSSISLKVKWDLNCEGDINNDTTPVSVTSEINHFPDFCSQKKSCKGTQEWKRGRKVSDCVLISKDKGKKVENCFSLRVQCKETSGPNLQRQLQTYKVMTALLCFVLFVILLIRFYRPTVKALQSRLSDRRQNRWIGPTQSHSVSYQRGKTNVKTTEEEKRLSYPALERLTVSGSREPSSNRNSGYNL